MKVCTFGLEQLCIPLHVFFKPFKEIKYYLVRNNAPAIHPPCYKSLLYMAHQPRCTTMSTSTGQCHNFACCTCSLDLT